MTDEECVQLVDRRRVYHENKSRLSSIEEDRTRCRLRADECRAIALEILAAAADERAANAKVPRRRTS